MNTFAFSFFKSKNKSNLYLKFKLHEYLSSFILRFRFRFQGFDHFLFLLSSPIFCFHLLAILEDTFESKDDRGGRSNMVETKAKIRTDDVPFRDVDLELKMGLYCICWCSIKLCFQYLKLKR